IADDGRRFIGWSGDLTHSEASLSITVSRSLTLFANFEGLPGDKKWEFTAGGGTGYSTPALAADGTLYFGSDDHKLYAMDGTAGTKKWDFTTGGEVGSSPAIGADGTVYFGSLDHKVYAVDGTTGAKKWEFETGDGVYSS